MERRFARFVIRTGIEPEFEGTSPDGVPCHDHRVKFGDVH